MKPKAIITTVGIVLAVVAFIYLIYTVPPYTKHYKVQDVEGYDIIMPWTYPSDVAKPFNTGDQIWINLKTMKLAPNDTSAIQFEIVKEY